MANVTRNFLAIAAAPWTGFAPRFVAAALTWDDADIANFPTPADIGNAIADALGAAQSGDLAGLERQATEVFDVIQIDNASAFIASGAAGLGPNSPYPLPTLATLGGQNVNTGKVTFAAGDIALTGEALNSEPGLAAPEGNANGPTHVDVISQGVVIASVEVGTDGAIDGDDTFAMTAGSYTLWFRSRDSNGYYSGAAGPVLVTVTSGG